MRKAIKESRWFWYIPVIWLFCIPEMSKWALSAEQEIDRGWRIILIDFLMFPTIIALLILIILIFKL